MLSFDVEVMLLKAFVESTCPPRVHRCASDSMGWALPFVFHEPMPSVYEPYPGNVISPQFLAFFECNLAMAEITANPLASDTADPHRLWNEAELANLRLDPSRGEGPLISSLKPGCQPHRHSR